MTQPAIVVPINRAAFYKKIRSSRFKKGLNQQQVNCIEAIFNEWERRKLTDRRWLSYMLATAYHETGTTMEAIEEWSKGEGRPYGKHLKMSLVPYTSPLHIFYGRGLVQLTWWDNYYKMGKLLGIDLLNNPSLALKLDIAVKIMFEGMLRADSGFGDFTGRCLEQYFNDTTEDWIEARRIINKLDRAEDIKVYAIDFSRALAA